MILQSKLSFYKIQKKIPIVCPDANLRWGFSLTATTYDILADYFVSMKTP